MNLFTAQKEIFIIELKKSLSKIPGIEELLCSIIHLSNDKIDNTTTLLYTHQKQKLVKLVTLSLYVLDGENEDKDLLKHRKLKFDKLGKMFKVNHFIIHYLR